MKKGVYGIYLSFYAILGFVLAFLGQTLLAGLLLGFVIICEKDEWLDKQVMQAFLLSLVVDVISSVFSIMNIFGSVPVLGTLVNTTFGLINGLISLVVLVFAILSITKVSKGEDAGVPVLSATANKAFGYVVKKVYEDSTAK